MSSTPTTGRRTRRGAPAGVVLCGLVAIVAACGAPDRGPLTHAQPTKEDVARQVLEALAARDTATLHTLGVTEQEFRDVIWPELPAAKPEVGMPIDYVWADTATKSRHALSALVTEHGGRRLRVHAVRFLGPSTAYDGFQLHSKAVVTVRDEDGALRDVRVFGSLVEHPSGWKVFSYIVD